MRVCFHVFIGRDDLEQRKFSVQRNSQITAELGNKVWFWMNLYFMGFIKCLNVYMQLYPPLFITPGNPKWVHKVVLERKVIKKKIYFLSEYLDIYNLMAEQPLTHF